VKAEAEVDDDITKKGTEISDPGQEHKREAALAQYPNRDVEEDPALAQGPLGNVDSFSLSQFNSIMLRWRKINVDDEKESKT